MSTNSAIQWTEQTWNPLAGCSEVSPGCRNCYAAKMAKRLEAMGQEKYAGTTKTLNNGKIVWTGKIAFDEQALSIPLKRKKPTVYFVNSMSDLFHEDVPETFIRAVFISMARARQHTFQVLTKRGDRMLEIVSSWKRDGLTLREGYGAVLPNVWLGVSVEDRRRANRIDVLRKVPAAVRFLSCEPLLEDLGELNLEGIHWVIVGGESGPGSRPCRLVWMRSIVGQCSAAGVACFVKQVGSAPMAQTYDSFNGDVVGIEPWRGINHSKGGDPDEWPADLCVREYPKGHQQ
jgi:protein gp37